METTENSPCHDTIVAHIPRCHCALQFHRMNSNTAEAKSLCSVSSNVITQQCHLGKDSEIWVQMWVTVSNAGVQRGLEGRGDKGNVKWR
jgi:hypothetical protein